MSGSPPRGGWRESQRATDREVGVVAALVADGSEKAAAHRLGLSHSSIKHHLTDARSKVGVTTTVQLVWILAPRGRSRSARCRGMPAVRSKGVGAPMAEASRTAAAGTRNELTKSA